MIVLHINGNLKPGLDFIFDNDFLVIQETRIQIKTFHPGHSHCHRGHLNGSPKRMLELNYKGQVKSVARNQLTISLVGRPT